ncbi:hypothetical protein O3P69_020276 [Scylla paramamosain]|uniref:Uncharacterized protein n=1 Tax=Scylla paramamosain TaxID=85552 RepID=A0AAW0TKJ9_SCYPA
MTLGPRYDDHLAAPPRLLPSRRVVPGQQDAVRRDCTRQRGSPGYAAVPASSTRLSHQSGKSERDLPTIVFLPGAAHSSGRKKAVVTRTCFASAGRRWFPGWRDQGGYGAQPSDDGLGLGEDCVELRASFRRASKGSRTTDRLYWNDRNCAAKNAFVCEMRAPGAPTGEEKWACSRSLTVTPHAPAPTIVTSPAFPARYPPSKTCVIALNAPPSAHLLVEFDAFVLEPHKTCDYDWVTLEEKEEDENEKETELLRFESRGNRVVLTFSSDYAHGYSGFRARVSARPGGGCGDGREVRLGDHCYLVVPFNHVSWTTATHICRDMQGQLARVGSREVAGWLGEQLRALPDYTGGRHYWVGGSLRPHAHTWTWSDGTPLNITGSFCVQPEWEYQEGGAGVVGRGGVVKYRARQ